VLPDLDSEVRLRKQGGLSGGWKRESFSRSGRFTRNLCRIGVGREKSHSELQILFSRILQGEPRGIGYAFEVRYTSDSGDKADIARGPSRATTGLVRRSKSDLGQPVKWVWRIGLRAILLQGPSPAVTNQRRR
jgi:hypothetical protein